MKKSYLLMAAAATMLAACSETDFVQEVNTQQAITFEGFAGKTTRTEIANVDSLKKVGFKVWGFATPDDNTLESLTPFSGVPVTYYENINAWVYTGDLREWEPGYEYTFGAIAPSSVANTRFTTDGVYYIDDAISGIASDPGVVDYLVATPQTIHASNARMVTLDFKHIMSKVSVAVTGSADVKIHKIQVKGWINNTENTYQSDRNPNWQIYDEERSSYTTLYNAGTTGEAPNTTDNYYACSTATSKAESLLIVPQETNFRFEFTYMVGATKFVKEVDVDFRTFDVNQHTTYSFNIGDASIEFSATMTEGWSTADPQPTTEEIYN